LILRIYPSFVAVEQLAIHCSDLHELDLSGSERIRNRTLDILEEHFRDNEVMVITVGGKDWMWWW
jgi:Asp/Glu/hydantoin racemase